MTANARFTLDDRYISCTLTILNAAFALDDSKSQLYPDNHKCRFAPDSCYVSLSQTTLSAALSRMAVIEGGFLLQRLSRATIPSLHAIRVLYV